MFFLSLVYIYFILFLVSLQEKMFSWALPSNPSILLIIWSFVYIMCFPKLLETVNHDYLYDFFCSTEAHYTHPNQN